MGKKYIRVPIEIEPPYNYDHYDYGEIWVNGEKYTYSRLINEISKPEKVRLKIIAIIGNRGIGKSSLARIMTVQCKDIMVLEVQKINYLPINIRKELYNVIEIHSIDESEWKPHDKV